jgi:hypothetical protein
VWNKCGISRGIPRGNLKAGGYCMWIRGGK